MTWPFDIGQAIANALWGIIVKNAMNFVSNIVNSALPYVAGTIALIILIILILKLF